MTEDETSKPEEQGSEVAVQAKPTDPNAEAAHYFLSELRTRISVQPLPYQHGDESSALQSLRNVFDYAREAMKKYPGCDRFADKATEMLNLHVRPVTAKWHRAKLAGRLDSRDGAEEFRGELERLQEELRVFASDLHEMAYGQRKKDDDTPPVIKEGYLKAYFDVEPLKCGIESISLPDNPRPEIKQQIEDLNRHFTAINAAELKALKARRRLYGLPNEKPDSPEKPDTEPEKNAIGLALSGGGIRSATFCLGIAQVLAERGLFKDIDYLSTVSGGGYTGSFITTRLGAGNPDIVEEKRKLEEARVEPGLGAAERQQLEQRALELERKIQGTIAGPDGPDPISIRYLRRHAKYLAALDLKQAWLMVTGTLGGMLLNWSVPLCLITLAAAMVCAAGGAIPSMRGWATLLIILSVISLVMLVYYGWKLPRKGTPADAAVLPWALALAVTLLVGVLWLLKIGYDFAFETKHWATGGLAATLVTAGPAIIRFIPIVKNPKVRKIALQILLWLAAIVVPLIAIALFYLLVHIGLRFGATWLFAASFALGFYALLSLNINLTGPHRLYRDQLARTFVQPEEDKPAPVPLSTINGTAAAPYHLINTTLNVPSSLNVALRERKSDFFLFSKEFSGSTATGYFSTKDWLTNSDEPDLATAMAVSGAAASSYMGLGSMPTLTALLTVLNVRLGFWIRNQKKPTAKGYPGFGCLLRETFGAGMTENEPWLNLSDGGHIENLAIYELLRRRCKMIISVDGEADPNYTFEGLMTLVRHAQIDFGVRIKVDLSDIRPDPKTGCSRGHTALCTVHYPDGAIGFIIYMKLSVTGNESEMIRRYRINHPEFPHQSTLDQFFDEEQFEVYRQLGVHVADGLFLPALMSPVPVKDIDGIRKWFRQLVRNLLPGPIPGIPPIATGGATAMTPTAPPPS